MTDYTKFKTEDLIDSFPQNKPLYKDSGLWQIRTDDMEEVILQQTSNETFRQFILRYSEMLSNDEYFNTELACKSLTLKNENKI